MGSWSNGGRHRPGVAEIRVRFSVGPLVRKVAGYGSPGRFAKPCGFTAMWVQIPRLPLFGSMVKRKSCCGSNAEFRVQILVGLLLYISPPDCVGLCAIWASFERK